MLKKVSITLMCVGLISRSGGLSNWKGANEG